MDVLPANTIDKIFALTAELSDKDQELVRERERYKVISDVVIAANKTETHSDLFELVLPILCSNLGFDGAGAYLIQYEMATAILKHSFNLPPDMETKYKNIDIMESPYRNTLADGNITILTGGDASQFKVSSIVFMPLVSPCGVVGGIILYSKISAGISISAEILLPTIGKYLGDSLRRIWSEKLLKSENERYKSLLAENNELICDNSSKAQELNAINQELNRHIEHLNASSEALFSIINALPLPIFWKTIDGVYLGANQQFYDVLQLKPQDLIGKTLHDIFPPIYWDEYDIGDITAIECKTTEYFGVYHSKEDNKEHYGRFIKSIFYNSEHNPAGIFCIIYPCEDACNEHELEVRQ